jgi:hypothetical protein
MKNSFIIIIFILSALILISFEDIYAQNSRIEKRKIYNLTELNIGYGLQGNVEPNVIAFTGITTLAGYSFSSSGGMGIGSGIFAFNGSYSVPLYLEGGYYFKEFGLGKMRFFAKADAGANFRLNGDIPPTRFFVNPLGGILIPVARHEEVSVSFGFFTQWNPNYQDYSGQNQFDNFINAKFGLRFF